MSKIGNSPLSVSQNFLTSTSVIDRAFRRTSLKKQDQVVEIGAGKGHLTKKLGETCGLVWALELDPGLCQKLRTKFADSPNIRVVCCDFLKWPLPRTPYRIFANIPFNRTTEILRRVTQAEHPPEEAWLVVEKGAAKRLLGQPAESTLTLLTKPLFQCDICYSFRRRISTRPPRWMRCCSTFAGNRCRMCHLSRCPNTAASSQAVFKNRATALPAALPKDRSPRRSASHICLRLSLSGR